MLLYQRPEDRQSSVLPGKQKSVVTYAGNFPSHSGQFMVSVVVEVVVLLSQDLSRLLVSLRSPADDGSLCLTWLRCLCCFPLAGG